MYRIIDHNVLIVSFTESYVEIRWKFVKYQRVESINESDCKTINQIQKIVNLISAEESINYVSSWLGTRLLSTKRWQMWHFTLQNWRNLFLKVFIETDTHAQSTYHELG